MGVVNATPDSFSDGGLAFEPAAAVDRALALHADGAAWLDIGGESTRPGARPVDEREELRRVVPVIAALRAQCSARLSIDTRKAAVARAALDAGADVVNDVSAGAFDPMLLELVAARGCGWIAMHARGTPETMQHAPRYDDAPREVLAELRASVARALERGVRRERIWIDPGIGFGKRLEDNVALLQRLGELHELGLPIVVGISRKGFLGALSGERDAAKRDLETAAALFACVRARAHVVRVHDVAGAKRAMAVAASLL
ncbi:MAG: dihydropteroate synthase [Planctomycetota bacterium]|nr:MAG: dihydropteroate synthase [Planctomycetota bacterium]